LLFLLFFSEYYSSSEDFNNIVKCGKFVKINLNYCRGNAEVTCVYAQDAIECAQRLMNNTADFGVFTAENAYHIASLGWEGFNVIKEIRHIERSRESFDYHSVVIVRADNSGHVGGLENLRGSDFCHPGLHYGRPNRWSENFLKAFERTIIKATCEKDGKSASENEVAGLSNFFNAGCRPGTWSNAEDENIKLKDKYTNLCSLCDDPINCTYENPGHIGALECLTKSSNAITYVSLQEAQNYFKAKPELSSQFLFLCRNGTTQSITNNGNPCVWMSQPWNLIVARNEPTVSLQTNIVRWMNDDQQWQRALRQMILPDNSQLSSVRDITSLRDYISVRRPIPIATNEQCPTPIRWCTRSEGEREKCEVIRMAALTTGIRPQITCNPPRTSTVACLSDISRGQADFIGIDSNFGYIARK
jgi:hypothetical protein